MDNKEQIGHPDRDKINISEYYEVEYWSKTFDVKPEVLREAVEKSGSTSVDVVRKYLNK